MIVILIILGALVGVGLPLYLLHRADERREAAAAAEKGAEENGSEAPAGEAESSSAASSAGDGAPSGESSGEDGEVCCGMHMTCEKDSLLADVSTTVDYFDDEELDRFAGREADGYTPDEIEEFRDVLLTLIPEDIAPWARSVQLRGITLPTEVREELLMIVAEARRSRDSESH